MLFAVWAPASRFVMERSVSHETIHLLFIENGEKYVSAYLF